VNEWSTGKVIHVEIKDFFLNFRDVQWKGKSIHVEYDLFLMMIRQWMDGGMTKEEALDLAFDMI
jgi:hypothetical protein